MPISDQLQAFWESFPTESQITGLVSGAATDMLLTIIVSYIIGGMGIAMAVHLFLLLTFSPVLALLNMILFLTTAALVTMICSTVAVLFGLQWVFSQVHHPIVSGTTETVMRIFTETAFSLEEMLSGYIYNAEPAAVQASN